MFIPLLSGADSYAQLITVLVIFILVLAVTMFVTRWMANYQKQQNAGTNIEIIETSRIANNKYVQILRIGETYLAVAVCKDTVTMLGEIPKEQLQTGSLNHDFGFRELLEKTVYRKQRESVETEGTQSDDEA